MNKDLIKLKNRVIILTATGVVFIGSLSIGQTLASKKNEQGHVIVYTSAKNTDFRLTPTDTLTFKEFGQPLETQVCVFVDPKHSFQTFIGIGGAFTDAAAETFGAMSKSTQAEFLKAYYDPKDGIGYTLGRTTIHSSDFSSESYTYVADNDKDLKTFNIQHDKEFRIPMIKQAIKAAGGKLPLYASPWSPPAWMKDTKNMLQGGKLLPEYRSAWADYYIKFIKSYENEGIPIWGLTVQNEPMAKQSWESCIFSAEDERDFIKTYLGPALVKAGLKDKKLIAWDHNRDLIYQRASTILDDPEAAKFVWGIGYHWYETWTGSSMQFDNLQRTKESFPNKNIMLTEACIEKFKFEEINDWRLGEKYGYSMINDFNSGSVAWTDWNLLLDQTGGPNHVKNFCFAPLIYDKAALKLHYTNIYYYLGHFSKFIRPGAKRISSSSNRDILQTTAFRNSDGSMAVIIMNSSEKEMDYNLWINGNAVAVKSLPHSIATLCIVN